jgi:hypothetical protein
MTPAKKRMILRYRDFRMTTTIAYPGADARLAAYPPPPSAISFK